MLSSVYFAHPTPMYGSPAERDLEQRFAQRFQTHVENPNQPQHSEGYQREGMDYFVKLCNAQDGVFFAPFADGSVGAGVAKEVDSFVKRGAPVFEYDAKSGDFLPQDSVSLSHLHVLNVDDSRARIKAEREQIAGGHSPYASLETYNLNLLG